MFNDNPGFFVFYDFILTLILGSGNFGGNCEIRNINIVKRILSCLDISENLIEFVEDRLGHDYRYAVDSSKSLKDLNWRPKISFEEGIDETIKWYQSNEDSIAGLGD